MARCGVGARVGTGAATGVAAIGAAMGVTVGAGGVRVGAEDGVTVTFADAVTEGVGAGEAFWAVAVGADAVAAGDALMVDVELGEALGRALGAAVIAALGGCSLIAFCRGDPPCARASKADAASIQIVSPVSSNALKASRFVRPIMTTMPPQHSLRFQVLRARNIPKARMAARLPGCVRVEISGFAD